MREDDLNRQIKADIKAYQEGYLSLDEIKFCNKLQEVMDPVIFVICNNN